MLSNNIYQEQKIPTQWERAWQNYRGNSLAMFGLWCLLFLLIVTLSAHFIIPYAPNQQVGELLMPPSWDPSGHVEFFFGTDDLGRDILSRLLLGTQLTFGYALLIALASSVIGIVIGVMAGMTRGLKSSFLNHILDTVLSIPSLLLAIIVVAYMGPGEVNILLAIWLALIPRFIRAIYTAVHNEVEKDYIIAARLDGANDFYLLYNSILPNILTAITNELTRAISIAILDIAALGFLGLGAQAPSSEWGAMLGDSIELIYLAPWTVTLPGLAITFSVLVVNLVGEGLRQAINAGID
ncbi:peptide ABC transporter permease [Photobacterium proteolyticum]|uniref:Peptide ABC transporter permease n=1 Tax=Photobacterium proteolyticum TaxID=1903952 RepID=A0A1Q9GG72_9GAMM|nr:putrescine export ABC transporter permease SapC [Photobacterium proteolyticum]OLQ73440.1 peptide ABC transporter permease [Photobacterium proteolyticum]